MKLKKNTNGWVLVFPARGNFSDEVYNEFFNSKLDAELKMYKLNDKEGYDKYRVRRVGPNSPYDLLQLPEGRWFTRLETNRKNLKESAGVEKGKFTEWCDKHGFDGINQRAINAALKAGGHAEKMAIFAINFSKGKYEYPKWYKNLSESKMLKSFEPENIMENKNRKEKKEEMVEECYCLDKINFNEEGWEKALPKVMSLKECVLEKIEFDEDFFEKKEPKTKNEDKFGLDSIKSKNYKFGE